MQQLSNDDIILLRKCITTFIMNLYEKPSQTKDNLDLIHFNSLPFYINELYELYTHNNPEPLINNLTNEFVESLYKKYQQFSIIEEKKLELTNIMEKITSHNITKEEYYTFCKNIYNIKNDLQKIYDDVHFTNFQTTSNKNYEHSFDMYIFTHPSLNHILKQLLFNYNNPEF